MFMKYIISAGGTGGHIYPALSVIEEIKKDKNNEVLYIGTTDRMEKDIVPSKGINYIGIKAGGMSKNIFKDVKNLANAYSSYRKCIKIMKDFKPDFVIGFGGYVTFPVLMAAHKLGIKSALHEQNKLPGKTNKILSKYADITFSSFEVEKGTFKNKVVVSGNPCAQNAVNSLKHDKTKLGFDNNKKLIIIVMGSLGSMTVNEKMKDFLEEYTSDSREILFITGKSYFDDFKDLKVKEYVKIVPFYNDLSGLIKSADLVISRAGASTISELLALNKPSILVPSPYVANNHQYYNALELKEKGLSIMLLEKDLNKESLKDKIDEAFNGEEEMISKLKNVPKLNASTIIVEELKK